MCINEGLRNYFDMNNTNLFNAAAPAIISIVLAVICCLLIFKSTIDKWYGTSRKASKRDSVKWWCGIFALYTIGNSLTGLFNEFSYLIFNNSQLRTDAVVNYLILMVLYPAILSGLAFLLLLFIKEDLTPKVAIDSSASISEVSVDGIDKQKVLAISAAVLVVGFIFGGFGNALFTKSEFSFNECQVCDGNSVCNTFAKFKGFKVLENSVQIYATDSNSMDRIFSLPSDEKMKCTIAKNRNNAFECRSNESDEYFIHSAEVAFDGKDKFIYNTLMHGTTSTTLNSNSKLTCKVN